MNTDAINGYVYRSSTPYPSEPRTVVYTPDPARFDYVASGRWTIDGADCTRVKVTPRTGTKRVPFYLFTTLPVSP